MPATLTTSRRAHRKATGDAQAAYVQTLGCFAAQSGLTLEALADRTGISRERITGMIRGRLPVAGEDALVLARVLGCGPTELHSGPPGPVVSGAALLASGAVLTKADRVRALYQLGLEEAPPAAPAAELHAGGGDLDDMPEQPWTGRTTCSEVFGSARCGWCKRRHEGVSCP